MDQKTFSLQMTVAEILNQWPELIPVFLDYKMSCVGCTMSDFETLSDAMEIYHLPRDKFLEEVEKTIIGNGGI